jgi:hypothetical protein
LLTRGLERAGVIAILLLPKIPFVSQWFCVACRQEGDGMSRFPVDIWRKLTGSQLRLCEELAFIGKGAPCYVGRAYLAKKLGVHIDSVSRITSRLVELGVLDKFQRRYRRRDGSWDYRPCVYKLCGWAVWKFKSLMGKIFKHNHRLTSPSDKTREEEKIPISDLSFLKNEKKRGLLERFAQLGKGEEKKSGG